MRYVSPENKSESEIGSILSDSNSTIDMRLNAVISALYYGKTNEFSGDILIYEFVHADGPYKRNLAQLFETLYGMRRTTYRVDESIAILENYKRVHPEYAPEISSSIDALIEYKEIFSNNK